MKLIAMAIPILPGKTGEWREFIKELHKTWWSDFKKSRQSLGVKERTFFQSTPHGDMVIVTLEGEDPAAAFAKFGMGKDEFTRWFVGRVMATHGVDLSEPMSGPMPELVAES